MKKVLLLISIIQVMALPVFSQIVIDDFNDNEKTGWSGSSEFSLTETNNELHIAGSTSSPWKVFQKTFSPLDMSTFSTISLRVRVPADQPIMRLRIDLEDINGKITNKYIQQKTVPNDNNYYTFKYFYSTRFEQSFNGSGDPEQAVVDSSQIITMTFFVEPGNTYTGEFYLDDIILEGAQEPVMIPFGHAWKYLDDGSDQGTAWSDSAFNDVSWPEDTAQFGYGDGDETTIIDFGGNATNKHITTYFRKTFYISDTSTFNSLVINLLTEDGAIVYINNQEVGRYNMPAGTPTFTTPASTAQNDSLVRIITNASIIDTGYNTIAVECHLAAPNENDMSFDLELTGTKYDTLSVVRTPYLQCATDTSMIVKWRTLNRTMGLVRYGTTAGNLTSIIDESTATTEHTVLITGLLPDTKYYYLVGNTYGDTISGPDTLHYFRTNPTAGTEKPMTFWVTGDAGKATKDQRAMRDAYTNHIGNQEVDGWLLLGDNAYVEGTDEEYQNAMFENMFENTLKNTKLFPTPGNHDLRDYSGYEAPYFSIFDVPVDGEAGGVPSGTESYYSFDMGNIHFISLDSYDTQRDSTATMGTWLKADLAANNRKWTVAFWHHPPYSKGTHDSDDDTDSEGRMGEMRQQILPMLEKNGCDLVLTGHSHVYERSYMVHGHYDTYNTIFDAPHFMGPRISGNLDLGEAYIKNPKDDTLPNIGTVYAVLGCSGTLGTVSDEWPMDELMHYYTDESIGSMILYVNEDTLSGKFLDSSGVFQDYFTIIKDTNETMQLVLGNKENKFKYINTLSTSPNPFTNNFVLTYTLKNPGTVKVSVKNVLGQEILTKEPGTKGTGTHRLNLQGTPFKKPGIYIVTLNVNGEKRHVKIIKK